MYDINKDRAWQKGVNPSQRDQQQQEPAADNNNSIATPNSVNTTPQQGSTLSQPAEMFRDRARTVYLNDPAFGQVDENGYAIDPPAKPKLAQPAQMFRDRARTVYLNDPAYGQVDENGYAIDPPVQPKRPSNNAVNTTPTTAWKKGVVPSQQPQQIADSDNNNIVTPSPSAKPGLNDNGTKVSWKGQFISQYGGFSDSSQGLIFKRTDGEGGLHHFTPAQTEQLRASNSQLIKESMQNGSQGNDVKVTFSVNNGRGSWAVEPAEQNRNNRR